MNASNRSAVITRTAASSWATHRPVPIENIHLRDSVLAPRMRTNLRETLPGQFRFLEETGQLRNFLRAAGKDESAFEGRYYNDSDVYKWVEAASWALAGQSDEAASELREMLETTVDFIVDAQREDGYLNTFFANGRADQRWTDLAEKHELYCAGHLIQAAIAHVRVLGSVKLLDVAIRFADHIVETFGPASEGKREETGGHPEIEMALVELYRETGDLRYLEQARFFIDVRGRSTAGGDSYRQDEMPIRRRRDITGHAVRAVYLNAGIADLLAESDDPELRKVLETMLDSMLSKRSYVTGGIGSRYDGEAFGLDYELPNNRAYAETCAAIGVVMWVWRMLLLDAADDSRLPDVLERVLYNAVLPGVSLDGHLYFYQNPLRDEDGSHRRQPWFGCACCPPNIARLIAQIPGYCATTSSRRFGESDARHDIVWLHLLAEGDYRIALPEGGSVSLKMTTRYPWDGDIAVEIVDLQNAGDFTLQIRIPDWAINTSGTLNGDRLPAAETTPGQYLTIRRLWQVGDVIRLDMPMPVRRIVSHPRVANNTGRVALMRGPLVYCVEDADNPIGDVRDIVLTDDTRITAAQRPELLGDVVVLSAHAELESPAPGWDGALYRNLTSVERDRQGRSEVQLTAIPYMVWANRGAGPMTVWLRRS